MELDNKNQKKELGLSRAHYYSHFDALAAVLDRGELSEAPLSPGEKWLAEFAADSMRIGEELAMLREDASAAVSEHLDRFDQGFSTLSKLHCILACQASAKSLAKSISESDWLSETPVDEEKGRMLSLAAGRIFGLINDDEKQPWLALLNDELSQAMPSWDAAQQIALGKRLSKTKNFTGESLRLMSDVISNSTEAIRGRIDSAILAAPYVASSSTKSTMLLDAAYGPNEVPHELMLCAKLFFLHDPSAKLEARFYALRQLYAYDHKQLMSRYPNGFYDGLTMFLPIALLGAGMGNKNALPKAMGVLSRAAREALGVEDESGEGPERLAPGALIEMLLGMGLPAPAQLLSRVSLEEQRAGAGFDAGDVVEILRAVAVEGLGFDGFRASEPAELTCSRLNGALREAAWHGLGNRLDALLADGADASAASSQGTTPLMLAASANHVDQAARLIPLSDVNAVDVWGKSALHYAALAKSAECCAALAPISDGELRDSGGFTAADFARGVGDDRLADWLEACALSVSESKALLKTTEGSTPVASRSISRI